jgi:tRNA 2-thiocytidine biosynthesis protein TtcA
MTTNNLTPSPPWTKIGRYIESLCRKALYDFEMLKDASALAIALSGGKDSLTLLYMLKAIIGKGFPNLDLIAIHVDGEFSCGAEVNKNYLKQICNELKIKLIICTSQIKAEQLECYSCSRERRKLIFKEAKKEGCSHIAFGHTRDDAGETLLLNLFQKAEFSSMLPSLKMYRYDITLIRPLIYVEEKDILNFANQYNFLRSRCNCPRGSLSHRKKVEDFLTQLEKYFPKVRSNLALSAIRDGSKKAALPLDNIDSEDVK